MINTISNVFCNTEITGEFLLKPIKAYHGFFSEQIEKSSGWAKVASIVTVAITGLFVYPILGVLACIGMIIKICCRTNETPDENNLYLQECFRHRFKSAINSTNEEKIDNYFIVGKKERGHSWGKKTNQPINSLGTYDEIPLDLEILRPTKGETLVWSRYLGVANGAFDKLSPTIKTANKNRIKLHGFSFHFYRDLYNNPIKDINDPNEKQTIPLSVKIYVERNKGHLFSTL